MKYWISLYLHSGPLEVLTDNLPAQLLTHKNAEKSLNWLTNRGKKIKSREDFEKERHKNVPRSDTSVILNGFSLELLRFSSWWNSRKAGSKNRLEIILWESLLYLFFLHPLQTSALLTLTPAHTHWRLCVLCLSPTFTHPVVLSPRIDDVSSPAVIQSREPGWLEGELEGKRGLIPENYVEML